MNRCYCIGCGNSLRDFDFSQLNGFHTVGTNHILRTYPEVEACVFLDLGFWVLASEHIKNYKGELWCPASAIPRSFRHDRLKLVRPLSAEIGMEVGEEETGIMGRLSGLAAINIAILKGYSPIYLLGYDMYGINYYDQPGAKEVIFARDGKCIERFKLFKDYEIYNLNPQSYLDVFPKVSDHRFQRHQEEG